MLDPKVFSIAFQGERPGEDEVEALIDMIGQAADLRQPLQLEKQLLEQEAWGVEVQQSMLTLLAVSMLQDALTRCFWLPPATCRS